MQIQDIVTKIYADTKTNSTSYPAANMLIDINEAYTDTVAEIIDVDGRWQWDDDNQTDEAIALATITASQQQYSPAVTHLKILRIEIKQNGATYFTKLDPYDQEDATQALDNVTIGIPQYYDLVGNNIFLYPIPNYTQASSLKIYYQRGPAEFTSGEVTTGTKQPGFASLFHTIIPNRVTYNYWMSNNPPMADRFAQKIAAKTTQLKNFYGKRDKDDPPRMTMRPINFR